MNRLPPEIVSSIARYVQDDEISNHVRQIVPLTHFCRYWRGVVISTPNHWTSISIESSSTKLAGLSLERAMAVPLDVHLDMRRFREDDWVVDLLGPKAQNAKSLIILNLPRGAEDVTTAFPNFPQSMPNLRSLKISRCEGSCWDRFVDPFGSLACSLMSLTLMDIPLYPSFLSLRTLTTLLLIDHNFHLHLNTLLDFLEENRSLQSATLWVSFAESSLRSSQRQSPIRNRLRYLSISSIRVIEVQALISNIALQRGARLGIVYPSVNAGLDEILTGLSTAHLSNLPSPTSIVYEIHPRRIRLVGPNGRFSFYSVRYATRDLFAEFPLLPLENVRALHFIHRKSSDLPHFDPVTYHLTLFSSLETIVIECETSTPYLSTLLSDVSSPPSLAANIPYLSALLSDPSSPPSLTNIIFCNCNLSERFMEKLTRFASDRKNTTSASLRRIVIVDSGGKFPSAASIDALKKQVPAVEVMREKKPPTGLT